MTDPKTPIAEYADVSNPDGEPVCLWERVSTDMTRQEIATQKRVLRKSVSENGYKVERVFRIAVSAYHGKHDPELQQALADVEDGRYRLIIAAMSSRFERRGWKALLKYMIMLDEVGGRLVALDSPMFGDMDTPMGGISALMEGENNHKYSKNISVNVNNTFGLLDEANMFRGPVPAGYMVVGTKRNKQLAPHTFAEEIVAQGFRDFPGEGMSSSKLARTFKAANARYNASRPEDTPELHLPETADGVRKMIRHPVYSTGEYRVKRRDGSGTTYIYHGPALITVKEQQDAVAALDNRLTGDIIASRAIGKEDFSGAVWCPEHPGEKLGKGYRHYSGGTSKDGKRPRIRGYYFRCCGKTIMADMADAEIHALMGNDPMPWWVPVRDDPNAERDRKLDEIRRELDDLPKRGLSEDEEDERRTELRAERKRLQAIQDQPAVTYGKVKTLNGADLTEGDRWRMMTSVEQRDWLTRGNFFITLRSAGDRSGDVVAKLVHAEGELVTVFEEAG